MCNTPCVDPDFVETGKIITVHLGEIQTQDHTSVEHPEVVISVSVHDLTFRRNDHSQYQQQSQNLSHIVDFLCGR